MLRIILVLISFLKIITCEKPSFELFKKIMPTTHFKKYFPYKIQFYSDGNIAMSVPRMYYGDVNIDNDLKAYPTLFNITKNKEEPDVLLKNDKIYSVMGFVIDKDDSLYILDQGIINSTTNTTKKDSAKLIMYNEKNKKKITYNFNNINLTYSLLTDVAVDHDGKYAYITDSGNQNVENNSPGIIVVNLKNNQTYKILNNHESFKHNENEKKALYVNTNDLDDKIYKYFHEAIGVNSIHISCNDETIYYTSYKKKNIFIVSTDEIQKAIENYEKSKNKDDLNNIKVNSININFASENTIISSKNNIFSLNLEQKYIEESRSQIHTERNLIFSAMNTNKNVKLFKPYANFMLVKILKDDLSAQAIEEHCRTKGIIIRNCSNFHGLDNKYIRFCFMKPKQNDLLVNTILELL